MKDNRTWIAVTSMCQATLGLAFSFLFAVNEGVSSHLEASIVIPDPSYNRADAITVFTADA